MTAGEIMKPILAGLIAWTIEFSVILIFLYLMRKEERKVINRRRSDE